MFQGKREKVILNETVYYDGFDDYMFFIECTIRNKWD